MSIYPTKSYPITKGLTEFEILKASHKFLREDVPNKDPNENEASTSNTVNTISKPWEARLAEKYYENLYREFAVCDLKHYKSGNFALRWRTESEVLSGAGESTCGNTRCKYHFSESESTNMTRRKRRRKEPRLATLELPFAYMEHGEPKSALVKVVLCPRCVNKLMWKRMKEKEMRKHGAIGGDVSEGESEGEDENGDLEDEVEKAKRKAKGKERENDAAASTEVTGAERQPSAKEEQDSRKRSAGERSRQKRCHDEHERDRYSRRRGSRSQSPHHSRSSRNRSRSYDHRLP